MKKKAIVFVLAAMFAVLVAGAVFAQSNSALGEAAFNRGNTALNQNNYDLAIREYTEAIRLLPNADGPYLNRGISYFEKNDWDAAISDFTQSIRLYADNLEAYYWRGRSYYEKKDYDRAIADLTQAIRLDPNDADAYYQRGGVYLARAITNQSSRDVDSASADVDSVARLEPNSMRSVLLRGMVNGYKSSSWYTAAAAPATGGTTPQTTTAAGGNTTRANALALRLGQDQSVSFSGDESRWYSFDITQNNAALVVQTRGSVDTLLDLYDGNGNRIASDDDSGDSYNARISRTLTPGKYYVEVKNYDKKAGQSTLNAAVQPQGSQPQTQAQGDQGTRTNPFLVKPLTSSIGSWNHNISSSTPNGEVWFSAEVQNGSRYAVMWEDLDTHRDKMDIKVDVMYQDGTTIFTGLDGDPYDMNTTFTSARTGTVLLRVYPYSRGGTGEFTITFTNR